MYSQLDTESATRDLTSEVTCLTDLVDASNPRFCKCVVYLGDGANDLDASGGAFVLRVNYGSQSGKTQTYTLPAQARAVLESESFLVPANTTITVGVLSPNGADTAVAVTAYLFALDTSVTASSVTDKTGYALTAAYDDAQTAAQAAVCTEARLAELDAANLPTAVDAILADTGTDGVVLAADAIKAVSYDESTAFPLKSADTGSTRVARTGADSDTLETLSDELGGTAEATETVPKFILKLRELYGVRL